MKWKVDFDKNFNKRLRVALAAHAKKGGKKCEAYAKKNAPWQDDTGNARGSIQGDGGWEGDTLKVYISGNTEYFPFLELGHRTHKKGGGKGSGNRGKRAKSVQRKGKQRKDPSQVQHGFVRYPILEPTMEALAPEIIADVKSVFKK